MVVVVVVVVVDAAVAGDENGDDGNTELVMIGTVVIGHAGDGDVSVLNGDEMV